MGGHFKKRLSHKDAKEKFFTKELPFCEQCHEHRVRMAGSRFCSKHCAMLWRWVDAEQRKILNDAQFGRVFPPEIVAKVVAGNLKAYKEGRHTGFFQKGHKINVGRLSWHKGRKISEEQRINISKGVLKTFEDHPEIREKISIANKKRWAKLAG